VSTVKSRSKLGEAADFNEIRFEDKAGEEYVLLHAQKDRFEFVEGTLKSHIGIGDGVGDEHRTVKKDRKEKIEGEYHLTVVKEVRQKFKDKLSMEVIGSMLFKTDDIWSLKAGSDITAESGAAISMKSGGDLHLKIGANIGAVAAQNVHIKGGSNIVIEGGTQVSIKAGGSSVVLGPDGVSITGTMVKINSGGSPAWAGFLQQLAEHLVAQWPAMQERLGDKHLAFVELAAQQALKLGLVRAASVARFVNLCFVWGPNFQDRPGFEWAQGLLAAPREREWATVHQLVRRSLMELRRLPEARMQPEALRAADERLMARFSHLGEHGALHPAEPLPLPLSACDLEAVELRLLEAAVTEHYELQGGAWQRVTLPEPAPIRVTVASPVPRLLAVLAHADAGASRRAQTRVQLRSRSHAVCDADMHPALNFAGSHGLWRWAGHETRAVSWPVQALAQPVQSAGPGTAVAEETSPDIFALELQVCGLRDEGDALGTQATQLWVWPAEQWWLELEREAPGTQPVVVGREPALRAATRCSVQRDGEAQDSQPLKRGFEQGLDRASGEAMQKLLMAISAVEGLAAPRLEGVLALLVGRASLSWGWRLGAGGMDGRAFMRLLGALDLKACQADLQAEAELALDGARARLLLRCVAASPLQLQLRRDAAEPPLLPTLLPCRGTFRLPISAELTPLATDTGTLLLPAGPCSGALVGEAGLRPRTSGGSGWEWFAQVRLEAATLPVLIADPVLGQRRLTHPLWPAQTLLDWSLA